jgi:xylan 1,4-beta-xylosidase
VKTRVRETGARRAAPRDAGLFSDSFDTTLWPVTDSPVSDGPTINSAVIRNPVLPGSHPDPSILRVGDEYILATSTFEWYPGVRLHRSRQLAQWSPVGAGGALDELRLLDLAGCPDSGGVWAPNLTYIEGLFHLVYSNVTAYSGGFTDCANYLVTAPSIEGPWSDPVFLHARGFDASLFHDGGESWLLNVALDWRPGHGGSAGLEATRYDRAARRLVGGPQRIELPEQAGWIEGPNLYRVGDWYYLFTADGGTGYDHQVTVARSRTLHGPYERDQHGPLITARERPDLALQKAGHGSLVETAKGDWYLAYLVARPQGRRGPCILGRETALAPVTWTADGWPRVPGGLPSLTVPAPGIADPAPTSISASASTSGDDPRGGESALPQRDGFDAPRLAPCWSTLRRPASPDWMSLTDRASHLRLRGGASPRSLASGGVGGGASLVARRADAPRCSFEAAIDYQPTDIRQLAGITAYYNSENWYFLHVTVDDEERRVLRVVASDRGRLTLNESGQVVLGADGSGPLRLGLDLDGAALAFRYETGDGRWQRLGPEFDATVLSDEHVMVFDEGGGIRTLGFTGAFLGLWAWDLGGGRHPADFDDAVYLRQP